MSHFFKQVEMEALEISTSACQVLTVFGNGHYRNSIGWKKISREWDK